MIWAIARYVARSCCRRKTVGALDASGAPTASRGTLNQWLITNGFNTDPTNPAPGEGAAVYFNNGDLEFGRDKTRCSRI